MVASVRAAGRGPSQVSWVAGADGCRAGWVVVLRNVRTGQVRLRLVPRFASLLLLTESPRITCVDVPIGLLDHAEPGGRACDRAARAVLGWPRRASVFSPPVRAALGARDHTAASAANRASSVAAVGISKQTFGILEKIREADLAMRPGAQTRVKECHPELSFMELANGKPLADGKKTAAGQSARLSLLRGAGFPDPRRSMTEVARPGVATDDVLDAHVCCWTALRIAEGTAVRLPDHPPRDAHGLHMEIWR